MAQQDAQFEQLKQKYQPVMNLMQQQQVRLQNVNMQGSKLYIRGVAPSEAAKNKVWDEIKLIDPSYSDLTADITVEATQTAGASVGGGSATRTYVVQPGDTLSKISREFYGEANQYMRIFDANRDKLSDPNKVQVGQQLVIPE